ncbi:MAG: hypothetical protein LBB67_03900 [Oscillospiraceae bacterium]|jgi:hypothetical protein|nr:hypothetical protein [Oscillospiraceae bacterium]
MHPKPNKFLSLLFSLIPGAGHMYLGFTRRGIAFMAAFAGTIVFFGIATEFLYIFSFLEYFCIALIPISWFVAFFDFWKYYRTPYEERVLLKDKPPAFDGKYYEGRDIKALWFKARAWIGTFLILAGASGLYNRMLRTLDSERHPIIWSYLYQIPDYIGGLLVIAIGVALILAKRKQIKRDLAAGRTQNEE